MMLCECGGHFVYDIPENKELLQNGSSESDDISKCVPKTKIKRSSRFVLGKQRQ